MRSVMLDTLAEGASAFGVAVIGAIILATNSVYWLDSAVALGIPVIISSHATNLIRHVPFHLRAGLDSNAGSPD